MPVHTERVCEIINIVEREHEDVGGCHAKATMIQFAAQHVCRVWIIIQI